MLSDQYNEYVVAHENDGAIKKRKIAFLLLYILPFSFVAFELIIHALFSLIIIAAFLDFILILLTWPLTTLEYEYIIMGDSISFHTVYGHRSRRKVTSAEGSQLLHVLPATEENVEKYGKPSERKYDLRSSALYEYGYLAVFNDSHGRQVAVLFNGYRQLIDQLKRMNFAATTSMPRLPEYQ